MRQHILTCSFWIIKLKLSTGALWVLNLNVIITPKYFLPCQCYVSILDSLLIRDNSKVELCYLDYPLSNRGNFRRWIRFHHSSLARKTKRFRKCLKYSVVTFHDCKSVINHHFLCRSPASTKTLSQCCHKVGQFFVSTLSVRWKWKFCRRQLTMLWKCYKMMLQQRYGNVVPTLW